MPINNSILASLQEGGVFVTISLGALGMLLFPQKELTKLYDTDVLALDEEDDYYDQASAEMARREASNDGAQRSHHGDAVEHVSDGW